MTFLRRARVMIKRIVSAGVFIPFLARSGSDTGLYGFFAAFPREFRKLCGII